MYQYPKQILTIEQQVQSYVDAGMKITSQEDVEKALKSIGFYRLRGYSFQLYDNAAKKYVSGTKFEDIIKLYQFDQELSALVFPMISKIEVALRVRLVEALLIHGEPLVLQDSSIFKEKKRYWQNMATVASEIAGGKGSKFGTGGMITKLQAAQIATEVGIPTIVMNGGDSDNIYRVLEGHQVGTFFTAK